MAILNQKRILNLIPKVSAPVTIHVSQGDVGTEIEFTLVKGDELFVNTGSLSASVHGVREDGANFGPFTCTLSGSKVTFPLHSEMTAVKGSALAEIVLVDNDGNKVGSANFGILVEESVFPLGVTYDNDVSVYESILAYVQSGMAQAISLYNSLQTQFDQVISGVTEDSEIINARIGYDNTTYNTLGKAIRTQISDLHNATMGGRIYALIEDTSILSDANTAPINTILGIINNSGTDIAHLPIQRGTLITFGRRLNVNDNFEVQIFVTNTTDLYWRFKWGGNWRNWELSTKRAIFDNAFHSSSIATYTDTSLLSDADNAPINNVLSIINNSGTDIAHLPDQTGTLITFSTSNNINSNFEIQIFIDLSNKLHYRSKFNDKWSRWNNTPDTEPLSILPQSDGVKIMLIGDSITAGQGSTGYISYNKIEDGVTYSIRGNGPDYPEAGPDYQVGTFLWSTGNKRWYEPLDGNGWSQRFKAYLESKFTNCHVYNYGMSGINSGDIIQFQSSLIAPSDAQVVIYMIGTNDRDNNTLAQFYNYLSIVVRRTLSTDKKVILIAPPPASVANDASKAYHMEDVEHIIFKVASEFNVPFFSCYEEFMDYCDLKNITIDSLLKDGLHPNDSGYEVLYKIVTKNTGINRKRPGATW